MKNSSSPSLLDREATGGQIAEAGFAFQEAVLLARLPQWLADDGFTAVIREAFGDLEASFYMPGCGMAKEFLECKNHQVTPAEFWKEIQRFQQMDEASPSTYRRFELVSNGISAEVQRLVNALQRVRGPGTFYQTDTALMEQSLADYRKVVEDLRRSPDEAEFILRKVHITADFHVPAGAALFRDRLPYYLSRYGHLPYPAVTRIIGQLSLVLNGRLNEPIYRLELENTVDAAIYPDPVPPPPGTTLDTATKLDEPSKGLRLAWEDLAGSEGRAYPGPERWSMALEQLRETKDWVSQHRRTRHIRLEGSRRLSCAVAIGYVFSAVSGFTVEINHRDIWWSTGDYAGPDTPPYPLRVNSPDAKGDHLIVVLGILRDPVSQVRDYLARVGLAGQPLLAIHGDEPVTFASQANLAVRQVKQAVSEALQQTNATSVHLFYAGPSPLAMFLGHRLNATAPVQCYEWVSLGQYVPTWKLPH